MRCDHCNRDAALRHYRATIRRLKRSLALLMAEYVKLLGEVAELQQANRNLIVERDAADALLAGALDQEHDRG